DSNALANHVPKAVTEERWHRFMQVQQAISAARLKQKIGQTIPVLIDEIGANGIVGRSQADAPDIDGVVHVTTERRLLPGHIIQVRVDSADEYDLHGTHLAA